MTRLLSGYLLYALISFSLLAPATAQTPPLLPTSAAFPIKVLQVWQDGFRREQTHDDEIKCGVSFENISSKVITAIKWSVVLFDPIGEILGVAPAFSTGTFSPGIVIDPRHRGDEVVPSDDGSTNGWIIPNPYGSQVSRYEFHPAVVLFADGTSWTDPANGAPMPAPSPQ